MPAAMYLLPAFVFQFGIVPARARLACTAYHWATFIKAEIDAKVLLPDFFGRWD
jgi:hypothetical protein